MQFNPTKQLKSIYIVMKKILGIYFQNYKSLAHIFNNTL